MKLTVVEHPKKKSISIVFDRDLPKGLSDHLRKLGFRHFDNAPFTRYAKEHPSYVRYAEDLQKAIENDTPWQDIVIHPSFKASSENINYNRFSRVVFTFSKNDTIIEEAFVLFEPYKALACAIADQYAAIVYKNTSFKTNIYPRSEKKEARELLDTGRILLPIISKEKEFQITEKPIIPQTTEAFAISETSEPAIVATEKEAELAEKTITTEISEVKEIEKPIVSPINTTNESKPALSQIYCEVIIPLNKNLKHSLSIDIAKKGNRFSYGYNYQKDYGDFSGVTSPIGDTTYSSYKKALEAGLKEILKLLKKALNQKDSILNNKKLNQKRITGTIKALTDFAKENDIIFPIVNITKTTTQKKQVQTKDIQDKDTFNELLKNVLKKLEEEINLLEKEEDKKITKQVYQHLLEVIEAQSYALQKELAIEAIGRYRNYYHREAPSFITYQIKRLITYLKAPELKEKEVKTLSQETKENMLVPKGVAMKFSFREINHTNKLALQRHYAHLKGITDDTLSKAPAVSIYELMQFAHPTEYGISVSRSALLRYYEREGKKLFKTLRLPTDISYPYINLHTHYLSVRPLREIISNDKKQKQWWHAVEHYRPIKDLNIALDHIKQELNDAKEKQEKLINPKTKKPKIASKEAYYNIGWNIALLKQSRDTITSYLENHPTTKQEKNDPTYIDKIVAIMHTHYYKSERLTKKKIEALLEPTGTPTLGKLWEAVELSWLLWYRQIYHQVPDFESALIKMIHFWNTVQPTYGYSDSSKEKYKQYSTPCLIGAMLAKYTYMDQAERIFEPSAGNGLLLVGADPLKTITNEIDTSRRASLAFQQFKEIHTKNASQPFDQWTHHFDVMLTNPPFAKWEDSKFDKRRIVKKYFNNHYELVSYMRLEHLMAGLALDTLKNNGRAGIIIMGHFSYDKQGFIARYAPFYKWLYRHYIVDDIINLNGFTLYNKQGAVAKTMLILIGGRKATPESLFPIKQTHPRLDTIIDNYADLWLRIKMHISPLERLIKQLKIATHDIL